MTKNEVVAVGLKYTKWQTHDRYEMLYDRAFEARLLDGDLVECGVALGGSAAVFAGAAIRAKPAGKEIQQLYLCDTYTGLPPAHPVFDGVKAQGMTGRCAGPVESVQSALKEIGFPTDKIHIVQGLYADTLPAMRHRVEKIALLHIDADWYDSTKICLELLAPKVVSGGFIIVDDYGFWEGCRKACDEWFAVKGKPKLNTIPKSPQVWWQIP